MECPRGDPSLRQHMLTVVCQGSSSEARPRGFTGGWPHRHPLPSTGPSPRLPEGGLNCIVCRNDLGAAGFAQCRVLFTSPLPDGSPGLTLQPGPLQGLRSLACCAYYTFLHTSVPFIDKPWWLHRPGLSQMQSLSSWSISITLRISCHPSVLDCCVNFRALSLAANHCFSAVRVILLKENSDPVTFLLIILPWYLLLLRACCPGSPVLLRALPAHLLPEALP